MSRTGERSLLHGTGVQNVPCYLSQGIRFAVHTGLLMICFESLLTVLFGHWHSVRLLGCATLA